MRRPSKRRWFVITTGQDGNAWPFLNPDGSMMLWTSRDAADEHAFKDLIARTYGYCIRPWRKP